MNISTTKFGSISIEEADVLTFVDGLIGMEDCQRWVLLGDSENTALAWLQSLERPEVALGVVSPRRFVPDYQVRVAKREIAAARAGESERRAGAGHHQPRRAVRLRSI